MDENMYGLLLFFMDSLFLRLIEVVPPWKKKIIMVI